MPMSKPCTFNLNFGLAVVIALETNRIEDLLVRLRMLLQDAKLTPTNRMLATHGLLAI